MTATANHPEPHAADLSIELAWRFHIAGHRVVIREATNHACQPCSCILKGVVHSLVQLLPDLLELPAKTLSDSLAADAEPAPPVDATDMREAQEVEGLGFAVSAFAPIARREPPELDQACLLWMQRKPVGLHLFAQGFKERTAIGFILKTKDRVINVSYDDDILFFVS